MFLDLDNFKSLNDTRGHSAGDSLLIEAGQRLRSAVRKEDIVARMGGDEFVVLLTRLTRKLKRAAHQVNKIGENGLVALAQTLSVSRVRVQLFRERRHRHVSGGETVDDSSGMLTSPCIRRKSRKEWPALF